MPAETGTALSEELLEELAKLEKDADRAAFLKRKGWLLQPSAVQQLIEASRTKLRVDPRAALGLAEMAVTSARELGDAQLVARSFRSKGNALYNAGENQEALKFHEKALATFRETGNAEEEGRTLNAMIQPHILVGEYEEAIRAAESARGIFERTGDQKRIGYVEINLGNVYHRQDRFEEGLASYERAYEMLLPHRDAEGLAVALYNMAVCLITLNDFPRALATYQRAREMFVRYGMTLLVAQSDYNIAYLYYLRGEYGRAIDMLRAARGEAAKHGDAHILALCYLDLAEIYLELNLSAEASESAHEGEKQFQKLGMGYEEAKCKAYEAMAEGQLGRALRALELFAGARAKFVEEKNLVWPWLIDLYQAVVQFNEGRLFEARRLAGRAADFFETSFLPTKAVLSRLLLARISLAERDFESTRRECRRALERLRDLPTPMLRYQAHFQMGEAQQGSGDLAEAYASYQEARGQLETLRSTLRGDELKIAFMKNRLEVYENLVELCLERGAGAEAAAGEAAAECLGYIELAKSRSLAELLMQQSVPFAVVDEGQSDLVRRIREMREDLNWYYRRIEIEQLREQSPSAERIEELQKEALRKEDELVRVLREARPSETNDDVVEASEIPSSAAVRDCLPPDAALVEYFRVKGQFVAALMTRERLEILPLTPVARVNNLIRMLRFQLSKFSLGGEYLKKFAETLLETTRSRLYELYQELVGPMRDRLNASHLVIVPHETLHYLPFHALFDGREYLIDRFSVSYAPSAGVYALCNRNGASGSGPALVLGVPDSRAPLIEREVKAVAGILPKAKLVIGPETGEQALRTDGANAKLIHIATHGNFRQDNPMFSGIRLGASYLNLYDLYQLKLNADLVALSGCATGLNVVAAGDELVGLVRALLYAGARSLLLSLWDVHDRSTEEFMTSFYGRLASTTNTAAALQEATKDLRSKYAHPYYWAPFVLTGKPLIS